MIIYYKIDLENSCLQEYIKSNQFKYQKSSIPDWIVNLNEYYKGFENKDVLELYIKK